MGPFLLSLTFLVTLFPASAGVYPQSPDTLFSRIDASTAYLHSRHRTSPDFESAVLLLCGASSMEELDEAEVARYEALSRSPLWLNSASEARLRSSGLFSSYQVAVILDARERGGPILSINELALLDGFSESLAQALSFFITLEASSPNLEKESLQQSLTLGGTYKTASGESTSNSRFKYLCSKPERWEAGVRSSSAGVLSSSVGVAYYGRRHLSKLIAGDFNARFGQGLAMWSGFSLSGLAANLSRNPTGVSLSHSCSSSSALRGVASEWTFGQRNRLNAIAFVRDSDVVPAANFSHLGLRGEWGLTALGTGLVSGDLRRSAGKFDFFCEAAYDFSALSTSSRSSALDGFAALAGFVWNPRYATKLSLLGRRYPSSFAGTYSGSVRSSTKVNDEAGVTLAFQSSTLTLVAEAVKRSASGYSQCRALARYTPVLEGPWICSLRFSERVRSDKSPSFRTDLRADAAYKIGDFSAALRANALLYRDLAWLGYSELSYRGPDGRLKCSAFARFTVFNIKNWDERIYAYEHDAPGYFTVPAHYGRGYALSFYTSLRFRPFRSETASSSYSSSAAGESSSASPDTQSSRTTSAVSRYFSRGSYGLSLRCSWLQRRLPDSSLQSTLTLRLQLAIEL